MTSTTLGPWLIPFSGEPRGRCPKCLTTEPITEHHYGAVIGMCAERRQAILEFADDPATVPDELTEHLCRGCHNCGYAWSEHVAGPEDLARVKAEGSYAD